MRIDNQNGEDVYKTIENEVLLEEVFDEFMRLLEELDADDENENGDEI